MDGDQLSSGRRSVGSRTPDRSAARVTPEMNVGVAAFCRSPVDLYGTDDTRRSVDDYPSYGGTPTRGAGALTPRGTPLSDGEGGGTGAARRSVSMIMKGLGLSSGRKSGRLSDADELQAQFDEIRRSNASPLRIPFTLGAGPAQIPEGDMMMTYSDVEAGRGASAVEMDHFEATNGGADTSYYNTNNNNNELSVEMQEMQASKDEGPPEHIYLQFTEVRYKVVVREGVKWRGKPRVEKEILHGITGSVGAGEMLAMMGPSGSGKTTLLNVLGGRRMNPQQVSGSILYNDVPYSKNLKRRIGFVTQDDVLFPHLTVKETLTFSALLRLPAKLSREQKVERAENVIAQLGLQKCKDTIIGNQFLRGVSGGERKRVCIGQEILTNPSILFLDEPTSGLDSTTALRIIRLLQNIAHQGRSVMATIHQPSSRAFHMFDKLILLSDGHSTYFGKARGAMTYFDSIGFAPLIPMNPADFLLDLCSGNTNDMSMPPSLRFPPPMKKNVQGGANNRKPNGASTDLTISSVQGTPTTLLAKDVKKYLVECCEQHMSSLDRTKSFENHKMQHGINSNATSEKREWSTTWWEQFIILFVRGFKERRHEYLSWMRVIQVVLSSLLAGCLWWHSKHNTPSELQDQEGLIFFIGVFWGYFPLFTAIFTFPMERPILAKERAADMYRVSAYFMARTLSDLPIELGLCIAFISILYFMASLRCTIIAFIYTILSVCLDVVTSQGVGFFIGAALMDVQKATTFASVFVLAFMLAGGYFVQKIPPFIGWIKYISFQAHTYEILRDVQYGHVGIMKHILAMVVMVFGYRIMAYIALRRMKVGA